MIYLVLNILFSSAFTLFIKWVTVRKEEDIITVGPINYITAACLIAPQFFAMSVEPDVNAALCGGTMGAIYFVAFFFVSYAIRHVGAAATTVVGSLSLLLPIIVAAFLWEEVPNVAQCFGIGFAVLALTLIGLRRRPKLREAAVTQPVGLSADHARANWLTPLVLVVFFLLAGSSRLAQRTLNHVSSKDQLPTFLFAAFVVASIPSIISLIGRRKSISKTELGMGVAMGASNILQTHFILKALVVFKGYIVFPISSSGGLVLTTFVATRLLGEKLTRQTFIGVAIAVVALVLLNWVGE
ncbi:MAG: EamA family transporter [Planctomycetaceae bacterium]